MITGEELEIAGFVREGDDGYTSTYRFNDYVCEGNDIDGYICDKSNVLIEDIKHLKKLYFKVTGVRIVLQQKFISEEEMKNFLQENEGVNLCDGFGRCWFYKNKEFYTRDLGCINFKKEFINGYLYSYAYIPKIELSKNRHKTTEFKKTK